MSSLSKFDKNSNDDDVEQREDNSVMLQVLQNYYYNVQPEMRTKKQPYEPTNTRGVLTSNMSQAQMSHPMLETLLGKSDLLNEYRGLSGEEYLERRSGLARQRMMSQIDLKGYRQDQEIGLTEQDLLSQLSLQKAYRGSQLDQSNEILLRQNIDQNRLVSNSSISRSPYYDPTINLQNLNSNLSSQGLDSLHRSHSLQSLSSQNQNLLDQLSHSFHPPQNQSYGLQSRNQSLLSQSQNVQNQDINTLQQDQNLLDPGLNQNTTNFDSYPRQLNQSFGDQNHPIINQSLSGLYSNSSQPQILNQYHSQQSPQNQYTERLNQNITLPSQPHRSPQSSHIQYPENLQYHGLQHQNMQGSPLSQYQYQPQSQINLQQNSLNQYQYQINQNQNNQQYKVARSESTVEPFESSSSNETANYRSYPASNYSSSMNTSVIPHSFPPTFSATNSFPGLPQSYPDITSYINSNPNALLPAVESVFDDQTTCRICGRSNFMNLKRHLKIHGQIPKYICKFPKNICGYKNNSYIRLFDFKRHLINKHFRFKDKMVRKLITFTEKFEYPGECPCGYECIAQDWLNDHIMTEDELKRCPLFLN